MGKTVVPAVPPLERWPDELLQEARESFARGRCTLAEFEEVVGKVLACDFPIDARLGFRVIPSKAVPRWLP